MLRIDLTEEEQEICESLSQERCRLISEWKKGCINYEKMNTEKKQIDLDRIGAVAEMCVAKHIGIEMPLTVTKVAGGADLISKNGSTIDVKGTDYSNSHLLVILKHAKNPCDIYIQVERVDAKGGWLAGWMTGQDLFQADNIGTCGKGLTYKVHNSKLTKFIENK